MPMDRPDPLESVQWILGNDLPQEKGLESRCCHVVEFRIGNRLGSVTDYRMLGRGLI